MVCEVSHEHCERKQVWSEDSRAKLAEALATLNSVDNTKALVTMRELWQ